MFAIDDATAVAVMPTPEAAGAPGYFTEGNPALGVAATYVRASFLNALMQEMLNILTAAGVTPSKTVYDQLLTSFRSNALLVANDTGPANACAIAYTPAITTLTDGMVLWFKAAATNTGATTLAVNAVGVKNLVGGAHQPLQGGEIVAGGKCMVVWNAAIPAFVLVECTGAALQVGTATKSQHALQLGQATGRLLRVLRYSLVSGVLNVSVNGGANTTVGATTYVPSSATSFVIAHVQGGGNGGAGASLPSSGNISMGAPGGCGGFGSGYFPVATVGASQPITVGAGGGSTVGGNGVAGGASSFGSLLTAPGGVGANALNNFASMNLANGNSSTTASPTGANIESAVGFCGTESKIINIGTAAGLLAGSGQASRYGPGGNGALDAVGVSAGATHYGAGGGAAIATVGGGAARAGGSGCGGVIFVWEYA